VRIGSYVLIGLGTVFFALPLLWLLSAPFDATPTYAVRPPADFTLDNFAAVGDNRYALPSLLNSVLLAGGTMLAVPATHQIAVAVPRSALGAVDLATAAYGTAMFGNSEAGEGIGYVRPVYDLAYWQDPGPDFWWITQYRFGGGAGQWTGGTASHDTDTSDANAIDIVVGPGQQQSEVMDWQAHSPVALPMVPLTL
jgi:hypothetical protein